MKKRFIIAFLLIPMLLLNSCSIITSGDKTSFAPEDNSRGKAVAHVKKIIEAIQNHDKDSLRAIFSKKALSEAQDLDGRMDYLFSFLQGKILSVDYIGTSLQVSNAGISPGSGIGNKRSAIDQETLGIPVLAVGIPMVVYAYTIASEILLSAAMKSNSTDNQIKNVINMIQDIEGSDLIVTPKNIDMLIENASDLVARALNFSIHKDLSEEEIKRYMS